MLYRKGCKLCQKSFMKLTPGKICGQGCLHSSLASRVINLFFLSLVTVKQTKLERLSQTFLGCFNIWVSEPALVEHMPPSIGCLVP
jgi:hypothetical protein